MLPTVVPPKSAGFQEDLLRDVVALERITLRLTCEVLKVTSSDELRRKFKGHVVD